MLIFQTFFVSQRLVFGQFFSGRFDSPESDWRLSEHVVICFDARLIGQEANQIEY